MLQPSAYKISAMHICADKWSYDGHARCQFLAALHAPKSAGGRLIAGQIELSTSRHDEAGPDCARPRQTITEKAAGTACYRGMRAYWAKFLDFPMLELA